MHLIFFEYDALFTKQNSSTFPKADAIVHHITSFLPPDPRHWFILVEMEFANYRITGNTSHFKCMTGRPAVDGTLLVRDIIVSSGSSDALRKPIALTEDQCTRRLFLGV